MKSTETKNTKAFYNTEIPSDWEIVKVSQITINHRQGYYTKEEYQTNGKYLLIRGKDLGSPNVDWRNSPKVNAKDSDYELYKIELGDFIFVRSGNIGDYGIVTEQLPPAIFASYLIRFKLDTKRVLNYYFGSFYKSNICQSQLGKITQGSSNININADNIKSLKIPLPPLPEQKAIAQVLSTADAAIHTTEKLIAQKELRKKWLMQQLLTGKKRLMGFGGEWKEHSYEKILKVVKRNFDWDENELYKLISVRRRSGGIFYREALYGHQILVKTLRTANEGDFLFSKMQILHGASALVTKEFDGAKISGSYIAVVPKDKKQLNMEFFQWYSQTPYFYHQTYISSYGVHIEKMTFDFDTFLQLEMKLPSIEEQTAIAQVLQAADKEISLLKAKAEKLREQKKGLMQQLLTGKVRLNINNMK